MTGFSMIVLTVIFGAAAFFRKKILDWFMESAARNISSRMKPNLQKTMNTLKTVRNVGIADGVMDWMSLRNKKNDLGNTIPGKPHAFDKTPSDLGRSPEFFKPEADNSGPEGKSVVGWQDKKLPNNKPLNNKPQKKEGQGIVLNNMHAIPGKVFNENIPVDNQRPIHDRPIRFTGSSDNEDKDN